MNAPADTQEKHGDSSAAIASAIADAIAARQLPPGTKLREEALSRLYSVSRTKIRAALLILSKDNLIQIVPDKGAFVSQPSEAESREIFAARRLIEAALAREFVAKAKPADYTRLEKHLKQEVHAISGGDSSSKLRSQLLGDFHVQLAEVVGNQVLKEIVYELVGRSNLITMLYQSDRDATCSHAEHEEFLAAAKAGNADKAAELMVHHLRHVEEALIFDGSAAEAKRDLVSALLM